jgi:hypothetical protein
MNTISPGPTSTALWMGEQGIAATVSKAGPEDPAAIARAAVAGTATGRLPNLTRLRTWSSCSPVAARQRHWR